MNYHARVFALVIAITGCSEVADANSRVIVTVKAAPNATLAELDAIHARIAKVVNSEGAMQIKRFSTLPQSVWMTSKSGLRALRAHPDVLNVQEDGLSAPN